MIVSSVFLWLEQIRHKAEAYECNTLEQRCLRKIEQRVPEETRWSCPVGFEGDSFTWDASEECDNFNSADKDICAIERTGPDLPDPPDNVDKFEAASVVPVHGLQVEMEEAKLSPLMRIKGKSLDSLLVTIREEEGEVVELRHNRHTPVTVPELTTTERRKGVFLELETIDEDERFSGPYVNIWDCESIPLEIHHGDILRTSVTFEDTVEELQAPGDVPIKYFANISEDLVQWLTELIDSYSAEEDYDVEVDQFGN